MNESVLSSSETMIAYGYTNPGDPTVTRKLRVPRPSPLPTEILVRVKANGLNPVDWRTRAGAPTPAAFAEGPPPHILGWDISGVVEAVGAGVYLYKPGDEVFGLPWFPRPARANAEFVTAPSRQFSLKPNNISHVEAAALPLAGLTAWQALTDAVEIHPTDRILIHAAGGGVGHLAVQIAKYLGAHVIGTASRDKHDWLRSLGVDELIDYKTSRFEDLAQDLDIVLDLVGGFGSDVPSRSLSVIRRGGTLIRVAPGGPPDLEDTARELGIHVTPELLVEPDGVGLANLALLVESGRLQVQVEEVFRPDQLADAHARGEAGRAAGKLVIDWAAERPKPGAEASSDGPLSQG